MVFEAHGMSFPCTELLLFNYAKVNTVLHSMAPLISGTCAQVNIPLHKNECMTQRRKNVQLYQATLLHQANEGLLSVS